MAKRISSVLPLFLITVICIGAVELGYQAFEMFMDRSTEQDRSAGDAPALARQQKAERVGNLAPDHTIIVKRNLFGASIEDPNAAKVETVEEPVLQKTDLDLVLMGTVTAIGEQGSRAIVLNLKKGKQEILKEGDSIEGAVIKEIKRGQVILSVDGRSEVMDLSDAAKHRTPAPAVSAAGGGPAAANVARARQRAVSSSAQRSRALVRRRNVQPRTVRPARRVTPRRPASVNQ